MAMDKATSGLLMQNVSQISQRNNPLQQSRINSQFSMQQQYPQSNLKKGKTKKGKSYSRLQLDSNSFEQSLIFGESFSELIQPKKLPL